MEIDDSLGLKSSFFISDEKIIVVTPQDIEEKNKLVISKKAGQYTYLHDKYDLIVTNAFNANIEASELCIIYFRDFYKEPKMKTLSIRFIDKEILLSNEVDKIHNSDSIDKLNNVSSIVNSQESSIHSEVPNSGDINAQGKLDRTLLHLASEAGEFDKVKLLLDRGANIEVQDKFGYTPIFLATQSGKWSIVKLLLDRGANIDAQDEKGQTLLHFAASGNNLDMVQFLLNRGANIEVQDKFAWTPILSAAQSGKWDVVKLLISNGAKFNNEITIQGTPLHFAVQEGNLDIIRFLLDRGASVNAKDENNKIPLDLATKEDVKELLKRAQLDQGLLISAQDGNLDKVVEYFIRKRVSLKVKDRDGKTPLDLAEQKGHTDIAKVIKQMQLELDKKLLSAVKNGDLNKVEDFISQGTSLEVKDSNGNTLLHYASQNDHLEVVEYLIKKGASLKTKNKDGKAPLDLALQKNYISIIEFLKKTQLDLDEELLATVKGDDLNRVKALVSQGASLEAKDNSNNTPLHNACNNGHVKVVEYLIQEGASLKAKNKDGEAPLHVAVQYDGTLEVIEFILSRDLSDINDITNSGKTPLHLAIREDKPNTVQLLLRKGASIAVKDKNGKTSLDLAKQEDYTNIVEMIEEVQSDLDEGLLTAVQDGNLNEAEGLVSRNANVNTRDKYSWTPLHWAAYKGHLEVAEFLVKKGADVNAASENLYGRRPIHIAIENNNKNIIEFLLSKEVGINDTDKQGYTPLHYAAWRGRLEVARFLIEKGADINAADTSTAGKKPIHVAAENNSESVIEFLLEKGVSVDEADKNGWTPLHYAARFGQPEVAKFLIEKGADINVAEVSIAGKRPIHVATEKNNKDIIEFFLSKGVSVNDTDKDSRTPLHWASWSGHLDLVKYFIDKGANINAECNDSKTPLDVAIDLKYNNVVEYLQRTQLDLNEQLLAAVQGGDFKKVKDLVSRGASLDAKDKEGKIPLHFAAQEGSLGMVQFFLDRGANIRAKDMYGWTPLHFAASSNKFDIVKFLFDKNANIKARDTYGDTPLHVAAQYSNKLEIVEFLLDNNANDINNVNNNGSTPLHVATQGNKPSTVKLLLNRGARIEVKDSCNRTPLDLAKQEGYTNIVRMIEQRQSYLDEELLTAVRDGNLNEVEDLVSHNANVNTTDIYSWTPLHWATFKDHLEIARFLIKKGADINAADKGPYGEKPIHVAAENNSKDIIEFFLSKGVGINDTDKQGYTPLHYAAWRGCLEVVKFLIEEYANSIFKYNNGSTLPCNASLGNHLDIIKCSIGEKNIFEIRDNSGRVPLHCAASNGKLDIVKYFIDEEKVDVNIKDNGYWTPLHWASWGGHLDVAKYLVDKRANINAKDKGSKIPLNVAIDQKHNDVVKYLEQAQLDLNKELLIAAKGGDLNKVIDLISKGANVKDNNDDTPLHLAVGYLDVVKYLINKGANINAKRKAGKTTLDIARDRGHNNVINYLEKELNQERGSPAKRKLRHLAVDLSDQPEIAASSGIRPSSWMGSCISWAKNLVASTFSIIPGLPTQYNIADKNNVKSDNKNIPQSTASVDWNNFLNNENIALASCVADALDDTSSKRYQNLISKGVEVVPNSKIAVEFALRKFDLFVEGKIRNLGSKEQARIHVELKDAYPEIIASLERGVEFSGNVGLDNVLEKCKKRFCANVLQKDKVSTCLSEIGVTKLGGNLNR